MKELKLLDKGSEEKKIEIRYVDSPRISIIVAMSQNGCIGSGNTIPWRIKRDMQRFKNYTLNKPVLMGIRTFESLPILLKDRLTIVLTKYYDKVANIVNKYKERNQSTIIPDIIHFESLNELRSNYYTIKETFPQYSYNELVIAGGATIYDQFLPFADKVLITQVKASIKGDTFWPRENMNEFKDSKQWKQISEESYFRDENNEYDYRFYTFERPKQAKIISIAGKCEVSKLDRLSLVETVSRNRGINNKPIT